MPPFKLHDGRSPVDRISVLMLFRDSEEWIPQFSSEMGALEEEYDCAFEYFFYENDSKDRTVDHLREFLQTRKGKLFSETLHEQPLPPLTSLERMERMAHHRNALLGSVRPLRSDWTLLIDTQTGFSPTVLQAMFAIEPAAHSIGMVTPYGEETGRHGHYYDTWAFRDAGDRSSWPHCVFAQCRQCRRGRIDDDDGPVDVRSAFAGFALVETALMNDPGVAWSTQEIRSGTGACEHWAFCCAIRARGRRIVVLPNVKIRKTRKSRTIRSYLQQCRIWYNERSGPVAKW